MTTLKVRAAAVLTMATLATSSLPAQSKAEKLDAYLTARAQLGQLNAGILVAQDGRILLEKGFGTADFEHRVPITPATRFEIASLTKAFTSAATLQLVEQGRLSLADSVCKWVTSCPDAWRRVTIAHLMHHTSGIPDYETPLDLGSEPYMNFMGQSKSASRILEQARPKPLDFPPGTKFSYSNTAYILLATIIEKAAGKPFNDVLRERVFKPAGMTATFASTSDVIPDLANAYEKTDFDFARVQAGLHLDEHTLKRVPLLPLDGPHGDGNIVATAHDLWRWTEALSDSVVLRGSSLREMLTPSLGGYGAGWFVDKRFGRRTATHTGALPGFNSLIEWYPDSHTLIVMLSNVVGIRQSIMMRDLAAILFDQPYDVAVRRTLIPYDTAAAAPLAGDYALADGTTATVSLDKAMLSVKIPGRFTAGAFPMSRDEYYAPFFDNTIRFERDASGKGQRIGLRINGVTVSGERAK